MLCFKFFGIPTDIANWRETKKLLRLAKKRLETNYSLSLFVYIIVQLYVGQRGSYFIPFDEDLVLDIAGDFGIEEGVVKDSIDLCVEAGLFNLEFFAANNILTSIQMQTSYANVVIKSLHKKPDFSSGYSLLLSEETPMPSEKVPMLSEKSPMPSEKSPMPSEESPMPSEESPMPSEKVPQERKERDRNRNRNRKGENRVGEECAGRSPQDGATRPHGEKFLFRDEKLCERWKMLLEQPKWAAKNTAQLSLAYEKLQIYADKSADLAISMIEHTIQGNYPDIYDPTAQMVDDSALRKKVAAKKGGLPAPPKEVERLSDFSYMADSDEPRCNEVTMVRNAWFEIQRCIPESMKNNAMKAKFHIENDTLWIILSPDISEWLKADSQRYRVLSEVYEKVEVKSSVLS